MSKKELMLLDWMRKVHQLEYAHCFQSVSFSKTERRTGIWAFILSTVVAFTYRFPFVDYPCVKEYILPFILFIVAILTGYQSFIRPGEKAEKHRELGIEYERIRHQIETILTIFMAHPELDDHIQTVKNRWDSMKTQYVKENHYNDAKKKVISFNKYPKELDFLLDYK
ncbi:SLATT domain-containing protein [Belliella sp. R4-6]|uniref:SLATT domain-containing protein n=1 Tax=Belliella alkalica TaxID=1730871 RepID=A0ABS9VFU5_9BACT|nr:SLATT domain-containing protein [Belliella alkalica]MCH7415296.1 SLATT domain-containing protein [Belliella alkalica]